MFKVGDKVKIKDYSFTGKIKEISKGFVTVNLDDGSENSTFVCLARELSLIEPDVLDTLTAAVNAARAAGYDVDCTVTIADTRRL